MTLILNLPKDQIAKITAQALAAGITPEQYACRLIEKSIDQPRHHVSDAIRDNMRDVPLEAFESLPADGVSQHDYYIYGVPKIDEDSDDDRPIWEVIKDEMKDVSPEDLASLPKDGASQVDHYLYGHAKRNL